jgi:hypothetical protein
MLKILAAVAIVTLSSGIAAAACSALVPISATEAIKANEQRIVCLQQEIAHEAYMRRLAQEIQANQTAIQNLQIQRRFDQLPQPNMH